MRLGDHADMPFVCVQWWQGCCLCAVSCVFLSSFGVVEMVNFQIRSPITRVPRILSTTGTGFWPPSENGPEPELLEDQPEPDLGKQNMPGWSMINNNNVPSHLDCRQGSAMGCFLFFVKSKLISNWETSKMQQTSVDFSDCTNVHCCINSN
jgi:hypothetical protein